MNLLALNTAMLINIIMVAHHPGGCCITPPPGGPLHHTITIITWTAPPQFSWWYSALHVNLVEPSVAWPGRPGLHLHWWLGRRPSEESTWLQEESTWLRRTMFVGTSPSKLATWSKTFGRNITKLSEANYWQYTADMLLTRSNHWSPTIWCWHFMWKACYKRDRFEKIALK